MSTYKIVRFYADDRPREVIVRGLTLAQAQAHCQRDDTHGDGWFDGYDEEGFVVGQTYSVEEVRDLAGPDAIFIGWPDDEEAS